MTASFEDTADAGVFLVYYSRDVHHELEAALGQERFSISRSSRQRLQTSGEPWSEDTIVDCTQCQNESYQNHLDLQGLIEPAMFPNYVYGIHSPFQENPYTCAGKCYQSTPSNDSEPGGSLVLLVTGTMTIAKNSIPPSQMMAASKWM